MRGLIYSSYSQQGQEQREGSELSPSTKVDPTHSMQSRHAVSEIRLLIHVHPFRMPATLRLRLAELCSNLYLLQLVLV